MIRSDDELNIVREQLARAKSALKALRRDIAPVNDRMFQVMAEPCRSTICELQEQIDTYIKHELKCPARENGSASERQTMKNRREMLAAAAITAGCAAIPKATIAAAPDQVLLELKDELRLVEATGSPDLLVEMLEVFQDSLWPEWRSHAETSQRMEVFRSIAESGSICFAVFEEITASAFQSTLTSTKGWEWKSKKDAGAWDCLACHLDNKGELSFSDVRDVLNESRKMQRGVASYELR